MSLERTLQCPSVGKSGSRVPFGPFQTRSVAKASFSPAPPPPAAPVRTDDRGVMPGKPLLAPSSDPSPLVIRSRVRRTVSSLAPPRHRRNSVYMWICGYIESAACRKSHTPYKLDKFLEIWRDVKSYNRIRKMELSQESNNEPEEDGG
jgi:hypothetical protein